MKIGKQVQGLMDNPRHRPKSMARKTHYLNAANYKLFEKICKESGHSTSVMLNALIEDFLSEYNLKQPRDT